MDINIREVKGKLHEVRDTVRKVKDKIIVFLDDVRYEAKGRIYNGYDRLRFWTGEHIRKRSVDLVTYRGEPKMSVRKAVKDHITSKVIAVKKNMPGSLSVLRTALYCSVKSKKRQIRKFRLSLKYSIKVGFYNMGERVSHINKSTAAGLSAVTVGGFALIFMVTTVLSSYAMGVTIDGQRVGFVESKEELVAMVEDVEKNLSAENYNADIQIDEDAIEVDSMSGLKSNVTMLDETMLKETIMDTVGITATASAITVNGSPVLYVGNEDEAQDVLESIERKYAVAGQDVVTGFRQEVKVTDTAVDVANLMPTKSAVTYLLTGNKVVKRYKVKDGDTDWDIAKANGLTEKDIRQANPGMNTKVIKEGDTINISKIAPFVHMEVAATVNVAEKLNYKTKRVKTDELYEGETKVKQEGKRGEVSVTKRAIYLNGKEESFQLIDRKITKAPEKRIVLVGTKEKPVENNESSGSSSGGSSVYGSGSGNSYVSGSGTLSNPMRHMELSSGFGYRWGRAHTGLDLRNPAGTAIYAAAGGRITYSGYDGAYGNTVRISHGNGMTTVYAHCSRLYVRSGQTVSRGQHIAAVGRTGRATGNHLHFEVRVGGTAKNPYRYL